MALLGDEDACRVAVDCIARLADTGHHVVTKVGRELFVMLVGFSGGLGAAGRSCPRCLAVRQPRSAGLHWRPWHGPAAKGMTLGNMRGGFMWMS